MSSKMKMIHIHEHELIRDRVKMTSSGLIKNHLLADTPSPKKDDLSFGCPMSPIKSPLSYDCNSLLEEKGFKKRYKRGPKMANCFLE